MSAPSSPLRVAVPYLPDTAMAYAQLLQQPWSGLLDSVAASTTGRFDILVCAPRRTLLVQANRCLVDGQVANHIADAGTVWSWLREQPARQEEPGIWPDIPFSGGLLGFLGYDLGGPDISAGRRQALPDLALGLYDGALIVDHDRQQTCLVAQGDRHGQAWLQTVRAMLDRPPAGLDTTFKVLTPPICSTRPEDYRQAFARVADYIRAGDCYQVNLAMRFSAPCTGSAWPLFRRLREVNPAPYSAWLNYPFGQVLSSSPEQFLALRGGLVTTRPIKGTRPRSNDPAEDRRIAHELAGASKDRAENLMIVDLLRNDLGKVCVPGSVQVPELFKVEPFASVHHLVSTVTGALAPGMDAFDLLAACFPGGSITGAPKRRAMQIIAELEAEARGAYCGAIGYVGADGGMDFNIAIRTLVVKDGEVSFWVGGGLVADSNPDAEYQECLDKARALLASLEAFR